MNRVGSLLLALALAACAHATPPAEQDRSGFVDLSTVIPDLVVDMRYYGSDNFIGRRIAGYEAQVCLLTKPAAAALAKVQRQLRASGFGLKVFDCYRPKRAVADFVAWARDLSDQKRKAQYYPDVDKSKLFELGYIAERSGHSRGSTVDIAVVDARGAELDMGPYDLFDTSSWPANETVSPALRANRAMLQGVMAKHGFRPLKEEWWHFTLRDEPYPETYFDFPVTSR